MADEKPMDGVLLGFDNRLSLVGSFQEIQEMFPDDLSYIW